MSEDKRISGGMGLVIGAAVVGLWLGLIIQQKNTDSEALERKMATLRLDAEDARADAEDARADAEIERRRLSLFRDQVEYLAQGDMVRNVSEATVIGGAAASGCSPGYTDPLCDRWYDSYPGFWARQQLRAFTLGRELKHYGRDLVRRANEWVRAQDDAES